MYKKDTGKGREPRKGKLNENALVVEQSKTTSTPNAPCIAPFKTNTYSVIAKMPWSHTQHSNTTLGNAATLQALTTADHVECSQTPNTENTSSESLTKLNYISPNIVNLALWNCEKCCLKLTYLSLQICPEKKKKEYLIY